MFEVIAYVLLFLACFTGAFALPVGRAFLVLCLLATVAHLLIRRERPRMTLTAWLWLLFAGLAALASVLGPSPARGLLNLDKLAWFVGIPLAATLVNSSDRLSWLLGSYAAGSGVLSVKMIVRSVVRAKALMAEQPAEFDNWGDALIHVGSMTDAQRLMLGALVVLGLILAFARNPRTLLLWIPLLLLQLAALVLSFKRGSWICTFAMAGLLVALRTNWKYLLVLLAAALCLLAVPKVRSRLGNLSEEFRADKGGRLTMWFAIAPELVKRHPMGMGPRVLTNDMMREIAPEVEHNRDHLHSNVAQVLVATGWLGFVVWLGWMAAGLVDGIRFLRRTRDAEGDDEIGAVILLLMLLALLLNGLVEYNFGDGELVLVYGLVMGCMNAGRLRHRRVSAFGTSTGLSGILG